MSTTNGIDSAKVTGGITCLPCGFEFDCNDWRQTVRWRRVQGGDWLTSGRYLKVTSTTLSPSKGRIPAKAVEHVE